MFFPSQRDDLKMNISYRSIRLKQQERKCIHIYMKDKIC